MLIVNLDSFPLLQTEKLVLRKIEHSDVNAVFFLRSDKEVLKYIDKAPARSKEEAAAFITMIEDLRKKNEAINWAITLKGSDEMIGNICIWRIDKANYRGEVGYVLHPGQQRKGIMHEALGEVIKYGFSEMRLHTMEANINPANDASVKLLEKNKFVREAYFKENFFFDGKFLDTVIYSLLNRS